MTFVFKRYLGKPDGTYDRNTGAPKKRTNGFSVSFHQNEANASGTYKSHTGRYRSIAAYRKEIMKIAKKYHLEIDTGVFNHEIEVSFWTEDEKIAQKIAKQFNQYAYYDNMRQCKVLNPSYNSKENPIKK